MERLVGALAPCSLHYIDIFGSEISDVGVAALQRLPHLTKVPTRMR